MGSRLRSVTVPVIAVSIGTKWLGDSSIDIDGVDCACARWTIEALARRIMATDTANHANRVSTDEGKW